MLLLCQVSGSRLHVCVFRRAVPAAAPDWPRVEGGKAPGPGSWGRGHHRGDGSPFQRGLCNRGLITHEMASSEEELQVSNKSKFKVQYTPLHHSYALYCLSLFLFPF